MRDDQLTDRLAALAEAIRDVPDGPEHQALVNRFFALIGHLQESGAVDRGDIWNLSSRRRSR